ncbi:hypothetical protein BGZ60DRAFT_333716, partial [Tricladium varicosporioides]
GQSQPLYLTRAIVTCPKIVVFDEVISAVNVATNHLVQQNISVEFKSCTFIVIVHRLRAIVDLRRTLMWGK